MSLVTVCYRAILKNVRSAGWNYRGGIDVTYKHQNMNKMTYLWIDNNEDDAYNSIQTHGYVPSDIKRKDLHTLLYTTKCFILQYDASETALNDLITAVKETSDIDNNWTSDLYINSK